MSTPTAPPLIDVNAEIHPFRDVQHWIDRTTDFFLFAEPDEQFADNAWLTADRNDYFGINGGYGIHFSSRLRSLDSAVKRQPPLVSVTIADAVGVVECTCIFGPDDLRWAPGELPDPCIYDPYSERRFAITEIVFRFGTEICRGYGIGRTYPRLAGGPVVMTGGVGNITSGEGRFAGLDGTFVLSGVFTPDLGFRGQVTLRMVDPQGQLRRQRASSFAVAGQDFAHGQSLYVLRGEKKDSSVKTTFGAPRGNEQCLVTPSLMRGLDFSCDRRAGRVFTSVSRQAVIADMTASVYFDLTAPPGTVDKPVPFTTEEIYNFIPPNGEPVDTLQAGVRDGISFKLTIPDALDQPAVRFAGFGPITQGTGVFSGMTGMLTVNSIIGISPHVLSLVHCLHFLDPDEALRAPADGRSS